MLDYKLLIIDKNQEDSFEIKEIIQNYFPYIHPIGIANSLNEATKLIAIFNPDIIIINPVFDDFSIENVLENIANAKCHIRITTSDIKTIPNKFNVLNEVIIKPIGFNDILFVINNLLLKIIKQENELLTENLKSIVKTDSETNHATIFDHFKKINNSIVLSSLKEVLFIKKTEIMYLSAHGRYTTIYLRNSQKHIATKSIGEIEELLPENNFIRIHHSYIINVDFLYKIIKNDGYIVELSDNTQLNVSRRKQEDLMQFLKNMY